MSETLRIEVPGGGAVELLEWMGDDLAVVNSARVSMAKESEWQHERSEDEVGEFWKKVLSERDRGLISYLARHQHWTPFAQCQVRLRIRMPIFVARQWYKHQIGITRNETSRRYVDDTPEFFRPPVWRERAENVKQGSGGAVDGPLQGWADSQLENAYRVAATTYDTFINAGICPEQARIVLPQGMFTEFVECGSLAAYARVIALRDEAHAQQETADYARAVRALIEPLFPVSVAALTRR